MAVRSEIVERHLVHGTVGLAASAKDENPCRVSGAAVSQLPNHGAVSRSQRSGTRRGVTLAPHVLGAAGKGSRCILRAAAHNLAPGQKAKVLLPTAIYCGVPAANSAFEHAQRALVRPTPAE